VPPSFPLVTDTSAADAGEARLRLRLDAVRAASTPQGKCTVEVDVSGPDGSRATGRVAGLRSPLGDARLVAEATLKATEVWSGDALGFELVGVKPLRAFDAVVMVVSATVTRGAAPQRLLGCAVSADDQARAIALATLSTVNGVVGRHIAVR
jgi:hypothetical protein